MCTRDKYCRSTYSYPNSVVLKRNEIWTSGGSIESFMNYYWGHAGYVGVRQYAIFILKFRFYCPQQGISNERMQYEWQAVPSDVEL